MLTPRFIGGFTFFSAIVLGGSASAQGFLSLPFRDPSTTLYHGWFYNPQKDYHGAIDYKPSRLTPDPIPVVAAADGLAITSCQAPSSQQPPPLRSGPLALNSIGQVAALHLTSFRDSETMSSWPTDIGVKITGNWSGSIAFERSEDGTNWKEFTLWSGKVSATGTSTGGSWGGLIHEITSSSAVRVRLTAYTSGSAVVSITASPLDT